MVRALAVLHPPVVLPVLSALLPISVLVLLLVRLMLFVPHVSLPVIVLVSRMFAMLVFACVVTRPNALVPLPTVLATSSQHPLIMTPQLSVLSVLLGIAQVTPTRALMVPACVVLLVPVLPPHPCVTVVPVLNVSLMVTALMVLPVKTVPVCVV